MVSLQSLAGHHPSNRGKKRKGLGCQLRALCPLHQAISRGQGPGRDAAWMRPEKAEAAQSLNFALMVLGNH